MPESRGAQEHLCSQCIQLRLALVVLGEVAILQSSTRVCFVDAHRQRAPEMLHSEVLPHGLYGSKKPAGGPLPRASSGAPAARLHPSSLT